MAVLVKLCVTLPGISFIMLLWHDRESEQLRQQLVQATSELQAVQQEALDAQAAARERQKRFNMLNATFRRKEEVFVSRAEEAEGALSRTRNETAEARDMALQAKQVRAHRYPAILSRMMPAILRCYVAVKSGGHELSS